MACKLEYLDDPHEPSPRILGRRAFGRDAAREIWSFQRLRQAANYVRNTYRQVATRALRQDGGLGFARGSRFDLLELEPVGSALAHAFLGQRVGKGGTSLRKWLLGWLRGDREVSGGSSTLLLALSPEHPTAEERALVRSRILETSTAASEKRRCLAHAVGQMEDVPDIEQIVVPRLREAGHREQANEVVAARAFGAVLDRARDAVAELTMAVEPGRGGVQLMSLERDIALHRALTGLRTAAKNFLEKAASAGVNESTGNAFADAIVGADDRQAVRLLVGRVGELLGLADDSVIRGALFRVVDATDIGRDLEDGAESIEPDRTGRTFRIANLHSLLRDSDVEGAR